MAPINQDKKGTRGTFPVVQLQAHDLREISVLMNEYQPRLRDIEQRKQQAHDFYGIDY